jgi:hypothetical protein
LEAHAAAVAAAAAAVAAALGLQQAHSRLHQPELRPLQAQVGLLLVAPLLLAAGPVLA